MKKNKWIIAFVFLTLINNAFALELKGFLIKENEELFLYLPKNSTIGRKLKVVPKKGVRSFKVPSKKIYVRIQGELNAETITYSLIEPIVYKFEKN
jgi:hypothetical protein